MEDKSKQVSAHRMLSFDEATVIRRCYQRNNRKGGQKNLRCFPNCCQGVHASTGYCGGPVIVNVNLDSVDVDKNYMLFAEFCPIVNGNPEGSLHERDILPLNKAVQLSEKEKNPLLPLFQGARMDGPKVLYCFNASKKGWHYGFVSNKHVSEMHHVLMVYLMHILNDGQLQCVDTLKSNVFSIYCRRRAKTSRLGELLAADPNPLVSNDERKRKEFIENNKQRPSSQSSDTDWIILNEILQNKQDDQEDEDNEDFIDKLLDEDLQAIKRIKLPDENDAFDKEEDMFVPLKDEPESPSKEVKPFKAPPGFYSVAQAKSALGISDVFKFRPRNLREVEGLKLSPSASATATASSTASTTASSINPSPMRQHDPHREFTQSAPHLSRQQQKRGQDLHENLSRSTPANRHLVHRKITSPIRHRSVSAANFNYFTPQQPMMFQSNNFMYTPYGPGSFGPGMMPMGGFNPMFIQNPNAMSYGFQAPQFINPQVHSPPISTPSSTTSYHSPPPQSVYSNSSTPSPAYTTNTPPYAFPNTDPSAPTMTILDELLLEDDNQVARPYPSRDVSTTYYQREDARVTQCLPLDLKPAPTPMAVPAPMATPVPAPAPKPSRDTVIPTEIVVTPRGRTARIHLGHGQPISPVVAPTARTSSSEISSNRSRHISINMDELMSSRSLYLRMGSPSQPSFVRLVTSKKSKRRHRHRSSDSSEEDIRSPAPAPAAEETSVQTRPASSLVVYIGNHCNFILKALAFVTLCVVLVYYSAHVASEMKSPTPTSAATTNTHT
ncbi:hypothetical protein THRCLA_02707 [Thraustotheca clavata]|uniref:Uncharacterized protein n=1 Tax=Thraustotheca clavata TaxID=74557 RepID=A0A1W0A498_9STRA|nr:hypothetical protein THRCLA_02707 [Thraustotheca clavata]